MGAYGTIVSIAAILISIASVWLSIATVRLDARQRREREASASHPFRMADPELYRDAWRLAEGTLEMPAVAEYQPHGVAEALHDAGDIGRIARLGAPLEVGCVGFEQFGQARPERRSVATFDLGDDVHEMPQQEAVGDELSGVGGRPLRQIDWLVGHGDTPRCGSPEHSAPSPAAPPRVPLDGAS